MTANPERGEVEIELDGQKFVMRPTYDAQIEIQEVLGVKIVPLVRALGRAEYGPDDLTAIITAGIRAGGETNVKASVVGPMVAATGIANPELINAVMRFLTGALRGGFKAGEAKATERT